MSTESTSSVDAHAGHSAIGKPLVNRRTIRVEWGDCDSAGIVFYPNYFAWFDVCTASLFERAGLSYRAIREDFGSVGIPAVDVRAQFVIPSSFGDELTVESWVSKWGRRSFTVTHRFLKGESLAVGGTETRVWALRHAADSKRIVGAPIPQEIIRRFTVE